MKPREEEKHSGCLAGLQGRLGRGRGGVRGAVPLHPVPFYTHVPIRPYTPPTLLITSHCLVSCSSQWKHSTASPANMISQGPSEREICPQSFLDSSQTYHSPQDSVFCPDFQVLALRDPQKCFIISPLCKSPPKKSWALPPGMGNLRHSGHGASQTAPPMEHGPGSSSQCCCALKRTPFSPGTQTPAAAAGELRITCNDSSRNSC